MTVKCHLHICLRGDISAKLIFLGGKNKKVMAMFCTCEIVLRSCVYAGAMQATSLAERELEVRKTKRYLESILFELGFFYRIKNVS